MNSEKEKADFPSPPRKQTSPAWLLFFLSPAIAELLSGSMPPAEFFNPGGFILVAVLYGGGAILVRELTFRWRKGWASLLLLGAAYGIVEEGLLCKSFFDPNWPDVGILGEYGRWAGVNWIWSIQLTAYHASISIAAAILLVAPIQELSNPKRPDNTAGMSLVGLAFAVFLIWLWRRIKQVGKNRNAAGPA